MFNRLKKEKHQRFVFYNDNGLFILRCHKLHCKVGF